MLNDPPKPLRQDRVEPRHDADDVLRVGGEFGDFLFQVPMPPLLVEVAQRVVEVLIFEAGIILIDQAGEDLRRVREPVVLLPRRIPAVQQASRQEMKRAVERQLRDDVGADLRYLVENLSMDIPSA